MSEPLRVWRLSDGQPGHDSRSLGILRALGEVMDLDVRTLRLNLRFGLARNLLRARLNHFGAPRSLATLPLFYRMDALPAGGCDLVVSAGGKTSFANAWIAAAAGAKNLFAGTLRRLQPRHFSLVMTLEPVPGATNNLVVPLLPTTIEPRAVARAGEALRQRLGDPDQRYWLLLAGGPGAGYRYHSRDWQRLATVLGRLAERHGIRWLLATSRRTGARGEQALRTGIAPAHLAAACWSGAGDPWEPEAFLGAADEIFVTEDSMTMLTEAMCARRPVYSLSPAQAAPDPRYEQALCRYVQAGRLQRLSLQELAARPDTLDPLRYHPPQVSDNTLGRQLVHRLQL